MASSTSQLFEATPALSLEEQANFARELIRANELYSISNSHQYSESEREKALEESNHIAKSVLMQLPNDCSALNLAARTEMDKGRLSHAQALLNKALELNDHDQNTLLNHGYLMISLKEFEEAENSFRNVLAIDGHSVRAFAGIALTKLRQQDYLAAFNFYRRLIELGEQGALTRAYFLESIEFLSADFYQDDMERLVVSAFEWPNQDTGKLARMAASLLTHKYQLDDPDTVLDLEQLQTDPLLLNSCTQCLLPSIAAETLLSELRKAILTEVALTRTLRDELLPLAIAIARYSARNDYVMIRTQEEDLELANLVREVESACHGGSLPEELSGALIVIAMYEPLYSQSFSYRLLAFDQVDWPLAIQDMMHDALYQLSEEHQIQYELFGTSAQSILNNEIKRVENRWQNLPRYSRSNLYQALANEINPACVPKRFQHENLNILIVGSGSGQRACYLASCFKNLNVYAVDNAAHNVAYGTLKARQFGIDNVRFILAELDIPLISEEAFDIIEFGEEINHLKSPRLAIEAWRPLLARDGLMRMHFNAVRAQETIGVVSQLVSARNLSATSDNIRHLRDAISKESGSGLWSKLFEDERFYSGAGCKGLFFNKHLHYFNLQDIHSLFSECGLEFAGFAGMTADKAQQCNPLAPYSLLAWHAMDQDDQLFADAYHIYCLPARH